MSRTLTFPRRAIAFVLAALIALPQAGFAQSPAKSIPAKPAPVSVSSQKVELLFVQSAAGMLFVQNAAGVKVGAGGGALRAGRTLTIEDQLEPGATPCV